MRSWLPNPDQHPLMGMAEAATVMAGATVGGAVGGPLGAILGAGAGGALATQMPAMRSDNPGGRGGGGRGGGGRGGGGRGGGGRWRRRRPIIVPTYISYPWSPYYSGYPYGYLPSTAPYPQDGSGYAEPAPTWSRPEGCESPLSDDCTSLKVTPRWAASCWIPRYHWARARYGTDYESVASSIAREEAPNCPFPAISGAASEYLYRVQLAVAVMMNAEGHPVPYPVPPSGMGPRPAEADKINQPYLRALVTGYV